MGGLMAALEDMLRGNIEKAAPAGNPSNPDARPRLQDSQAGSGKVGAPNYSDAFAPAHTQTVQLEADGRPGLEAALRKAAYSPEEARSGRILNQILKDNQIRSMNSLKAGSRVLIPSRSQGGGAGSAGFAFPAPGFGGSGNEGGGFSNGSIGVVASRQEGAIRELFRRRPGTGVNQRGMAVALGEGPSLWKTPVAPKEEP
jgi:hypothetical protein